jgi:hypothetical protein
MFHLITRITSLLWATERFAFYERAAVHIFQSGGYSMALVSADAINES